MEAIDGLASVAQQFRAAAGVPDPEPEKPARKPAKKAVAETPAED